MEKKVKLKDGTEITIRPITMDDLDKSHEFFLALPEEDRAYLRVDVTKREVVQRRIKDMEIMNIKRIIALHNDNIIANAALEIGSHGWEGHIGELRLIVSKDFQRKGLGVIMANELYSYATREKVEEMVIKIMKPQLAARKIFERLGFKEDVTLKDYVKDISGQRRDLVIFRCNLADLWQELEDYFHETDHRGIA
ncbi:GNAT family N-acetyltransferase [Bacteroidota bacterium]